LFGFGFVWGEEEALQGVSAELLVFVVRVVVDGGALVALCGRRHCGGFWFGL
jgi:hypothetical protein